MQAEAYDAIVIGSGQGGAPLSIALAKVGWKTGIVEHLKARPGSMVQTRLRPS
jgi:pyruvate/2-oxoglutarate dehydrogenase complex dihydrolipoamide dehydrogenase (E3) component